jgi:hypothetical protein
MKVPGYNKENRRQSFEQLPKGAYVCKILNIEAMKSKSGKDMAKISFDIAEGDYKDFYTKQYQANTSEDKKWSYDAVTYLVLPYEGCDPFITQNWDTFWANVEDSNNGFVFDGDEKKVQGKTFGGVFRIEETEGNNGNVYTHTRLAYTRVAQDIRDGKVTKLPNDKLVGREGSPEDFVQVTDTSAEDLPWK